MTASPGPVESQILEHLSSVLRPHAVEVDGAPLRYLDGGSGPPLVLLHGRNHAATVWLPVLTALARRFRVLAIDLPGFGCSRPPRPLSQAPRSAGVPPGVAFFVDPVEALLRKLGVGSAAFVGHSLGALVAVELALRGQVAAERLALLGPMGVGPEMTLATRLFFRAGPERLARRLGQKAYLRLTGAPPAASAGPMGARLQALEWELLTVLEGRPEATAAFSSLFPLVGPPFHRLAELPRLTAPTLLLCGEKDPVFPPSNGRAAAAALPHAQLEVLPLGHAPHLERPDLVLPPLLAFLDPRAATAAAPARPGTP